MSLAACRLCGNQRRISRCLLAAFWLVLLQIVLPAGAQGAPAAIGYADTARYDASRELIVVQGWLHEAGLPPTATVFSVTVGGSRARVLDARRTERREAAQALGLAPDSRLGFRLEVAYPRYATAAPQAVVVAATLADGSILALPSSDGAQLHTSGRGTPLRHYLFAGLLLPSIALLTWARRRSWGEPGFSATGLWLTAGTLYAVLVAGGITGSSLGALVGTSQYPNPLLDTESSVLRIAGSPRSVRSDEWLVLSGSALAQVNHHPPFPVVNRLLGLDGQNMMVIGMTGVPVAHVSAVARPATWGYFFLPLRQALAWHWYFPFFTCLLGLWGLLQTLAGDRPTRNLGLALLFCSAPYAAGWSNWPLYVTGWACGALALALRMLCQPPIAASRMALQGMALGWLLACFALTLYPPWQIPLATLCLLLFAVCVVPAWRSSQGRWARVLGYGCAGLMCGTLLLAWWLGAHDAIAAITTTVYPGQRAALHGGDMPATALLRGYSNVDTLPYLRYSLLNASEFASYFFLFVPLGWLALRQLRTSRPGKVAVLLAFTCFVLLFAVAGVPSMLAQALLWHRVPGPRLDLALGLTYVLLLSLLPVPGTLASQRVYAGPRSAAGAAIASALVVAAALHALPPDFYPHLSIPLLLTLSSCAAATAYWWMRGHLGAAIVLQLLLNLVAIATFHPIGRAPTHIAASTDTLRYARDTATGSPARTLSLDRSSASSMTLAAAGIPVVGGAFYYPQPTLWNAAHLPPPSWPIVNRYQHLTFTTSTPGSMEPYTITTPAPDEVLVTVNPGRFDFSRTGAQRVVAGTEAADMADNPSLRLLGHSGGRTWFAVRPVPGTPDF